MTTLSTQPKGLWQRAATGNLFAASIPLAGATFIPVMLACSPNQTMACMALFTIVLLAAMMWTEWQRMLVSCALLQVGICVLLLVHEIPYIERYQHLSLRESIQYLLIGMIPITAIGAVLGAHRDGPRWLGHGLMLGSLAIGAGFLVTNDRDILGASRYFWLGLISALGICAALLGGYRWWIGVPAIAVQALTLIGSASKQSILIVGIVLAMLPVIDRERGWRRFGIAAALGVAGTMMLLAVQPERFDVLFNRIEVVDKDVEGQYGGRNWVWEQASKYLWRQPAFGLGIQGYINSISHDVEMHPHNLYIQSWVELGITGLVIIVAITGWVTALVILSARAGGTGERVVAAAWCAFLFSAQATGDLVSNRGLWSLATLIVVRYHCQTSFRFTHAQVKTSHG